MQRFVLLLGVLLLGAGCDSLRGPNQSYTMPSMRGRAVDAATRRPIEAARVYRWAEAPKTSQPFEHKGSERLMLPGPVRTDAAGWFLLSAERAGHLLFGSSGALEVTLVLESGGYQTLITNVDLLKVSYAETNGVPLVEMGDLLLSPEQESGPRP